jgi:hypothetical protein
METDQYQPVTVFGFISAGAAQDWVALIGPPAVPAAAAVARPQSPKLYT